MKPFSIASFVFFIFLGAHAPSFAQDEATQYCQAGNTCYSQKNYDTALRYYDAALQSNPNLWQAYQGLGNSYYAKGDNARALSNYQKCLSLHPDNAPLSEFVNSMRAEMKAAHSRPKNQYSEAEARRILQTASGVSDAHFELSPSAGVALTLGDSGLGFGGGLSGFSMLDSDFGLGGMLHYYTFSYSYSSQSYYSSSGGSGTLISTTQYTDSSLELAPALKYKFEGRGIRPFIVAGIGISRLSAGYTYTYDYQGGNPSYRQPNRTYFRDAFFPMVIGGGGVEFSLDRDTSLFLGVRFDVILGGTGAATYIPVEVGLNFKL